MFPDLKKENCALFIYILFVLQPFDVERKKGMCVCVHGDIERESDDGYRIEEEGAYQVIEIS